MKHIELDANLINLLKEKISQTNDGYIHIQIKDGKIAFITFEKKDFIVSLNE